MRQFEDRVLHLHKCLEDAFFKFPRHEFLGSIADPYLPESPAVSPEDSRFIELAYRNQPLMYVGADGFQLPSSSSEPAFILHLLQLLDLKRGDNFLEIGSGKGWLCALASQLVGDDGSVTGVELEGELADFADNQVNSRELANVRIVSGDGLSGLASDNGPYDKVICTAALFDIPCEIVSLVKPGGKIVMPVRSRGLAEEAYLLERKCDQLNSIDRRVCKFVPLRGSSGTHSPGLTSLSDLVEKSRFESSVKSETTAWLGARVESDLLRYALVLTGFLSKVSAEFFAFSDGRPGQSNLDTSVFGDLYTYGFGLIRKDGEGMQIWKAGEIHKYGSESNEIDLERWIAQWVDLGRPGGFAFGVTISTSMPTVEPNCEPNEHLGIVERRNDCWIKWSFGGQPS